LELGTDPADGRVLCVTGYCPHTSWLPAGLGPPDSAHAELYAVTDETLKAGVGLSVNDYPESIWTVRIDLTKEWLCIGDPDYAGGGIEFMPGCIAVLRNGALLALWLKPMKLPTAVVSELRAKLKIA